MSTRKMYRPGGRTLRTTMTSGHGSGGSGRGMGPKRPKTTSVGKKPNMSKAPSSPSIDWSKKPNTPKYKIPKTPKNSGYGWGP